jgi:predicted RNase H-like HicB family nuclease
MRCHVTLTREGNDVVARCVEYAECSGHGATREAALAALRESVLFWLEACPCDTTADGGLRLEVMGE